MAKYYARWKMVKTVGIERTVTKWVNRVRVAGDDYKKGVTAPKTPWSQATMAAKETYRSAISAADLPDRFERGVSEAGDAKWSGMASVKGVERYPRGVELGQPYYRSAMQDVLSTIEGVTLTARGPAGAAQNYDRVKAIGEALRAMRLGRS